MRVNAESVSHGDMHAKWQAPRVGIPTDVVSFADFVQNPEPPVMGRPPRVKIPARPSLPDIVLNNIAPSLLRVDTHLATENDNLKGILQSASTDAKRHLQLERGLMEFIRDLLVHLPREGKFTLQDALERYRPLSQEQRDLATSSLARFAASIELNDWLNNSNRNRASEPTEIEE